MTHLEFERFLQVFSPEPGTARPLNVSALSNAVDVAFGVSVPPAIVRFWEAVGSGYFGERELCVFGLDASDGPRSPLVEWNEKKFWRKVYPEPRHGGPVFFAETCFGEQIGFRWTSGQCWIVLFIVDTFESFVLTNDAEELFSKVLVGREVITDPRRLEGVLRRLGPLKSGMHFAPIVSPLLGGTGDPSNFHLETPDVHFITAVATYEAVKDLPPGTPVSGIDIRWHEGE